MDIGAFLYFRITDKNKECSLIGNDDLLVKLTLESGNLEVLNHPQSFLDNVRIQRNGAGKYFVKGSFENGYVLEEIIEAESENLLNSAEKEWKGWQNYFEGGGASVRLIGPSGGRL